MAIPRLLARAATILVAVFVAFAVPTSQVRTIAMVTTCCCPDPAHCHCPDHKADHSKKPSIRQCHRTAHDLDAPQAPAFTPPTAVAVARTTVHVSRAIEMTPTILNDVPRADEPYGPS